KSTSAHEQAIYDYFLLIKPTITVAECCEFLCIESRHIAKRILQSMKLRSTGRTKGRIYHSPWGKATN
ncbi:MAG: NERD domain-containing protein, partial [Tuberibacillus sp.]